MREGGRGGREGKYCLLASPGGEEEGLAPRTTARGAGEVEGEGDTPTGGDTTTAAEGEARTGGGTEQQLPL